MDEYLVGTASVDITPDMSRKVYLAGFAPNRTATGVLHPLTARALYVRDASNSEVCFVALDLIGFLNPDIALIRDRLAGALPGDRLIVCSTHTHSGPDTLGLWGPAVAGVPYRSGVDAGYVDFVIGCTAQAVSRARSGAHPAALKAASFEIPTGWVRNERKGGGAYPKVEVLSAQSGGKTIAMMVNAAAHPESLWERNRLVSPDYPHAVRLRLEELGVEAPLFFAGPLGAMLTPDVPLKAGAAERHSYIGNFGRMLAELAVDAAASATPLSGPVTVATRNVTLANANKRFEWAHRLGFLRRNISGSRIETQVSAGSIGALRFATIPGEPSPEVGHELYEAMGSGHSMILALGQDELGYIIPPSFFQRDEYRYEQSMSVGPHMAPTIKGIVSELLRPAPPRAQTHQHRTERT